MGNDNRMYKELTPRLVFVCIFGSLGAVAFGIDNSWYGLMVGSSYFNQKFGTVYDTTTGIAKLSTQQLSVGNALANVGVMIGCFIAPWINEAFGRKKCFLTLAVIGEIGALIQATCAITESFAQLIVGRVFLEVSVGIASATVGAYLSEVSPAASRGIMLTFYSVVQNVGYLVGGAAAYSSVTKTTYWCWLLPILLQFISPTFMILGTSLIPESPRWLVSKGKLEEATKVLRSVRRGGDDAIRIEVEEIQIDFAEQKKLQTTVSALEMFKGPNLRRTLVAVGLQSLQQGQGVGFVASYLVILFQQLGIKNVNLIVMISYVTNFTFSCLGFYLPDVVGRRRLLLVGAAVMTVSMAILGGVTSYNPNPTGARANLMIAGIFAWNIIFSVSWSPMVWTVSSEIPANHLREKTLALAACSGFAVGLIVQIVSPYIQNPGYGNLGGRIGYLWMSFSFVSFIWTYLTVPELKGRSLEELDAMFEAGVSTREFGKFDSTELMEARLAAAPVDFDEKKMEAMHIEDMKA